MNTTRANTHASTGPYPIVVIEPDEAARAEIDTAVPVGLASSTFDAVSTFTDRRRPGGPTVAVFGPSFGDEAGLDAIGELTSSEPDLAAILIVPQLTTTALQHALRCGIRDVIDGHGGIDPAELREAIGRAAGAFEAPASERARRSPDGASAERGRVIAVASSKGGAGKSVLATNLAVALARRSKRPVVLVDADLQFGDVAVMLSLTPRTTIFDAVGAAGDLRATLEGLLIEHPSGAKVLAAPVMPGDAEEVTAPRLLEILALLREMAAFVVIDTSAHFDDIVLSVMEESDDIVLVAGMDVPSVKNVRVAIQTLKLLGTPLSKVHLALNRISPRIALEVSEVEQMLGIEADCRIPHDFGISRSVNKGVAIVADSPRSAAAKAFDDLATRFLPAVAAAPRRSWRGRN